MVQYTHILVASALGAAIPTFAAPCGSSARLVRRARDRSNTLNTVKKIALDIVLGVAPDLKQGVLAAVNKPPNLFSPAQKAALNAKVVKAEEPQKQEAQKKRELEDLEELIERALFVFELGLD